MELLLKKFIITLRCSHWYWKKNFHRDFFPLIVVASTHVQKNLHRYHHLIVSMVCLLNKFISFQPRALDTKAWWICGLGHGHWEQLTKKYAHNMQRKGIKIYHMMPVTTKNTKHLIFLFSLFSIESLHLSSMCFFSLKDLSIINLYRNLLCSKLVF